MCTFVLSDEAQKRSGCVGESSGSKTGFREGGKTTHVKGILEVFECQGVLQDIVVVGKCIRSRNDVCLCGDGGNESQ